jgi:branched-chain amino acid aminotransferase
MHKDSLKVWRIEKGRREEIELADLSTLDAVTRQLPEGFYSTFRTFQSGTRVLGLKAHLQRLFGPLSKTEVGEEELRRHLRELLKDYPAEARVRAIMTRSGALYAAIEPLKALPREIYEHGVRLQTIDMARESPRLKSTAFIQASRGEREQLARQGIFEALLVKNGRILEGMTSNFFYVIGAVLYTAKHGVLPGVTRQALIRAAREGGMEVRYKSLKRDQLNIPHEAFITSSSRGVVPVIQIDGVRIGQGRPGRITKQAAEMYEEYVKAKAEKI